MSVAVTSELPERHRKWQPYPAYKDSGVEWLRRIPVSWEAKRLKFVARLSYGDSLSAESREGGEVQVFGSNGPVGSHSYPNTLSPALIIGRKGSFGKVNFSDQPCFAIDTTYFIDARNTKENLRWLFYSLELLELDAISEDSAVPGLSREFAHEQWLPVPSLPEQGTIAAFLDRETAKVDALVKKKERLIELLQEKRTAIIGQAVTKGLDPNVSMKDPGVEWLGEIPAHWEIFQLRRVVKTFVDYRGKTPEKVASGIPLVTARNIKNGHIDFNSSEEFIKEEDYSEWMVRGFPEIGDVVITTEAPLGETAQVDNSYIALAQRVILLKANKERISNEYLKYYFTSQAGIGELWTRATGSTAVGIKAWHLKEIVVVAPTLSEQERITDFLDRETPKIDALIAKVCEGIEKLKEYRTALISAAVTGKIDVRAEFPGNDHANASADAT